MSDTPILTESDRSVLLEVRRHMLRSIGETEHLLSTQRGGLRIVEERLGLPGGEIRTMTGGAWVVTPRDEKLDN